MTEIGNTPALQPDPKPASLGDIARAAMPWSARLKLPGATPFEMLAAAFLVFLVLVALFVNFIPGLASPKLPYGDFSQPPDWSLNGLLGTDDIGRSILSRVLYGARTSMMIVAVSTTIAVVGGLLIGMLAGYYRGIFERIADLIANTLAAMPSILVVLSFVAVTGPSIVTIIVVLGIFDIGTYARVAKAGVISQSNRDYVLAAHGDFGNGRVQRDIVEGTRYLLAQGIGDARRVGIAGASFGGYATLLGVTWQGDLFKLGLAIVPPPDFAWDLAWVARSREADALARYLPFADWLRQLAVDLDDPAAMARLHAQSPLANAGRMDRPLLVVAGGDDHRVAIRGVLGYAARLKQAGKDVSLLVDDGAGHSNDDPLAHEATLYLFERMLQRHLGMPAPAAPDPALHDYLKRHLRLAGEAMQGL